MEGWNKVSVTPLDVSSEAALGIASFFSNESRAIDGGGQESLRTTLLPLRKVARADSISSDFNFASRYLKEPFKNLLLLLLSAIHRLIFL
jgi:hypothetical protein